MRYDKRVPEVNTQWKPENKTIIVNKNVWDRANSKEKNKIGLKQLNRDRVMVNSKM